MTEKLTPYKIIAKSYNPALKDNGCGRMIKHLRTIPIKRRLFFMMEAYAETGDHETNEHVTVEKAIMRVCPFAFRYEIDTAKQILRDEFNEADNNIWRAMRSHKHHKGEAVRRL